VSGQHQHLCVTGGEPLMPQSQQAFVGTYRELELRGNLPQSITFETNGTQKLTEEFKELVSSIDTEIFFSVSPKLWTVAGERREKAIHPELVKEYRAVSGQGQLKFVLGNRTSSGQKWKKY
jgi:organic radical activating enzyme